MRLRDCIARGHPFARYGVTTDTAMQIVRDFCDSVVEVMLEGEDILLPGIGKIGIVDDKNRVCRDPRTGETVTYIKKQKIRFRTKTTLARSLRVK